MTRGQGKLVTLQRAQEMASTLLESFYKEANDTEKAENKRKTMGLAWAIIADKWTILHGKPTQIVRFEESEGARGGLLKIASRISALKDRKAG